MTAPQSTDRTHEKPPSFLDRLVQDYILSVSTIKLLTALNLIFIYFLVLLYLASGYINTESLFFYPIIIFVVFQIRHSRLLSERIDATHRIPFFADSVANSLAVGCTLEQAFEQSLYYLRGNFKAAFKKVMLKNSLGKEIGPLLRDLDKEYPQTGLKYLISLMEEYKELGVGISSLLKKIAEVLKIREEAEVKVRTILAAGSSYAKLSVVIFGLSFSSFGFLLKNQMKLLFSPELKPIFLSLLAWAVLGMVVVMRITSVHFCNHFSLSPVVKPFMKQKKWTINSLLDYCCFEQHLQKWRRILLYLPLFLGFCTAYLASWYTTNIYFIFIAYGLGIVGARFCIEFILKGIAEDQVIEAIETFPDFLQIFIIGINSGLNQFKAYEFAEQAIEGSAPKLLLKELQHTRYALIYGEKNAIAWQYLMNRLPFGTIMDFCEIMIISPLHGESIIKSIQQIISSYQSKRLNEVEQTASKMGQYAIPLIVVSLFPVFLFAVFAPLWTKLSTLFQHT